MEVFSHTTILTNASSLVASCLKLFTKAKHWGHFGLVDVNICTIQMFKPSTDKVGGIKILSLGE
jgi:hypothetical protein